MKYRLFKVLFKCRMEDCGLIVHILTTAHRMCIYCIYIYIYIFLSISLFVAPTSSYICRRCRLAAPDLRPGIPIIPRNSPKNRATWPRGWMEEGIYGSPLKSTLEELSRGIFRGCLCLKGIRIIEWTTLWTNVTTGESHELALKLKAQELWGRTGGRAQRKQMYLDYQTTVLGWNGEGKQAPAKPNKWPAAEIRWKEEKAPWSHLSSPRRVLESFVLFSV